MHRPGRSNISARLTSFAPSSSHRMWEPINPSERDSFAREIADLPRSFNRDRDSFIISFDALGIFYPERRKIRWRALFFNLSRTFKNEDEEDSPLLWVVPEFLYSSYLDYIFTLFFSRNFHENSWKEDAQKARRKNRSSNTPVALPHRSIAQGVDQKMEFLFFVAQEEPFHRRNPFFGKLGARATFLNRGGRKEKMDRWRETRLERTRSSTTRRRIPNNFSPSPTLSPTFSYPFFFPQGEKSRRLFNLFCPRRGSSQRRGFQLLRKRALRRLLRAPFAELPRVPRPSREPSAACAHTMFLFLLCTHKCPTENVNLPSERFSACAIRARLAIDARLDKKKRERQREGLPLFFEARFSSSHSVNWNEF